MKPFKYLYELLDPNLQFLLVELPYTPQFMYTRLPQTTGDTPLNTYEECIIRQHKYIEELQTRLRQYEQ